MIKLVGRLQSYVYSSHFMSTGRWSLHNQFRYAICSHVNFYFSVFSIELIFRAK